MHRKQLIRWSGKFVLWLKLHPDTIFGKTNTCGFCPHSGKHKVGSSCPERTLLIRNGWDFECDKKKFMFGKLKHNDICIEWIKNV
jgi:hypothetical protein